MTSPSIRLAAAVLALAVTAAGCGASDAGVDIDVATEATTSTAPATEATTTEASTTDVEVATDDRAAQVMAAAWADGVTITIDGDVFVFESDGLPAHEYLDEYLADGPDGKYLSGGVVATPTRVEIPLDPVVAESPTTTGFGAIGVAVSGAVFFNPYEGDGTSTVANDDNSTIDGVPFIDACGGHPLPNSSTYHYHGIPFCVFDALDTTGEHSAVIGYLLDGHALYGPQDVDGEEPTDLDACIGHVGEVPGLDEPTYHYHVSSQANYISECLVGEFTATGRGGGGRP